VVEQRPSKPHVWVRFLLPLFMRFNPQPNFLFAKKTNLLTDINLYTAVRLSKRIRQLPTKRLEIVKQLPKVLLGKKSTLRNIKSRQTTARYKRLFFSQKSQTRLLYGSIDRRLRPYKRFRRMGEWVLPSEEHDPEVDIPFSLSPEAAHAATMKLTSFWEKHYPHILGVKGPRYSNILVKRTRWYGIKPTSLVKYRYGARPKSSKPLTILASSKPSLTILDDDDLLKTASTKSKPTYSLGTSSNHRLTHLALRADSTTPLLGVNLFGSDLSAASQTTRQLLVTAVLRSSQRVAVTYSHINCSATLVNYSMTQERLTLTNTFFGNLRRSAHLKPSHSWDAGVHPQSFWFPRLVKNRLAFKRRTRRKKKSYRYFFGVTRLAPYAPTKAAVLTPHTSMIFHKYYTFIRMSRIQGRTQLRRPLFSHMFSSQQLYKKTLITIRNDFDSLPLRKVVTSGGLTFANYFAGLGNMWDYQANDNFLESSLDNHLLAASAGTTSLAARSQMLGLFARVTQTSKGNPDLTNYELSPLSPVQGVAPLKSNGQSPFNLLLGGKPSQSFIENNLLFKFLFWDMTTLRPSSSLIVSNAALSNSLLNLARYSFSTRTPLLLKTNLWPLNLFNYTIRRKVLKVVVNLRYLPRTTSYFYKTLVSFMEFYTGKKVYLKFNAFVENSLTYSDMARCYIWVSRVLGFQKILGHRIFVHESLRIFHVAIRFRDPTFLANWIKAMLYRMSFWKYRVLFRYIKFVLRTLFWSHFEDLDFKGVKLALRGKISVAGNARARSLLYSVGQTSHAEMNNRVLSHFTTVHSFTGVMGFRLTFYF
jgi:hypothetical protein